MNIMHSSGASGATFTESTAIRLRAPKRLAVGQGRVWLTIEGDNRDFFPTPGTRIDLPAERLIVIQGGADASWHLQPMPQGRRGGWLQAAREGWLALQGAMRRWA